MSQSLSRTGKRLMLVDFIRGINFVSMVLYHAMYDIVYIFDRAGDYSWYKSTPGFIWQQLVAWTFILLSGFSFNLGKKHFKHGVTIFLAGAAVTVVTMLFMPSQTIHYGVLTFMGLALLVLTATEKLLSKVHPAIGTALSVILFAVTRNINDGILGIPRLAKTALPAVLYKYPGIAILGFPTPAFRSADYFPILPWIFLYLAGYFAGRMILAKFPKNKESFLAYTPDKSFALGVPAGVYNAFCAVGRHTLILYLLHQPVVYLVLSLVYS